MDRKIRMLRIAELLKSSQEFDEADISETESVEEVIGSVDSIQYDEGRFGNHELFAEDFTTAHRPKDINQLISMSGKSDWITIPDVARRRGIPHLYYLDPNKASLYEKYFGIKTEYGFLHTPATKALQAAVFNPGAVKRFSMAPMIEIPPNYPNLPAGTKFMVLDPKAEANVVSQAARMMERAQGRPEHVRKVEVGEYGEAAFTATKEPGISYPGREDVSPEVESKIKHLTSAIEKFYEDDKDGEKKLRKLHSAISTINRSLDSKMDSLLREQRDKNRAIRFEFNKDEYEDVIKQAILRILIKELTSSGGPFEGVDIGIPSSITVG